MAHSPRKMLAPKTEKIEEGNAAELRRGVGEGSNRDSSNEYTWKILALLW